MIPDMVPSPRPLNITFADAVFYDGPSSFVGASLVDMESLEHLRPFGPVNITPREERHQGSDRPVQPA